MKNPNRKPQPIPVACDWCRSEIGEECHKCGGTGVMEIPERKAS